MKGKRLVAALLTATMVSFVTLPAQAADWNGGWNNYWNYDWSQYRDWWQNRQPEVTLGVPEITDTEYHHKTVYYGDHDRLVIDWTEVENAEWYEVEVTKGDGSSKVYAESDNRLFVNREDDEFLIGCTTRKTEAGHKRGTVRVRAMTEEVSGDWSESVEVWCNGTHFG